MSELDRPRRLKSLPDAAASRALTSLVLEGREDPPWRTLEKAAQPLPDDSERWDTEPLRYLFEEAMGRFGPRPTGADAWLAPRLHATLRLTRRESADPGVWNHLALCVAPDFVRFRWGGSGARRVAASRFLGPWHTQCFSRLWWAAEIFRNGQDYESVVTACSNQDVFHTSLHMDIFQYRPIAQSLVRMLRSGAIRPTTRDVIDFSAAVAAAGGTLVFESLAPDTGQDADALKDWIDDREREADVPLDRLPVGPKEGRVSPSVMEALIPELEKIYAEAPWRARRRRRPVEESPAKSLVD
ncbi:DUF6339 family protein [Streptomyces viridochromogenes]|uniref:DUF6339 family protein n=1 Tax=Streptomyces viridochromogenes TaxID=1938 RepID=UPI00056D21B3|nr:DUF6339 family protein [Streptomyces viridochromogenes]